MALGSSAPEIMLSCIETIQRLGTVPGELGPSTIVGSAAFNLLLISAVSIYAVHPGTDERTDEELIEDNNVKGVKKIKDQGVYFTTTIFALFAYIWLYWCLLDGYVDPVEAWLTLFFFVALIGVSYIMDKIGERKAAKLQADEAIGESKAGGEVLPLTVQTSYTPAMFYNILIPLEQGKSSLDNMDPKEAKKIEEMRGFLRTHFNTDKVQNIEFADLKTKVQGESVVGRLKYRNKKEQKTKKKIGKNEVYRKES